MMKIANVWDFERSEADTGCAVCHVLRAMEAGRVHADAMIEGLHLVAFALYHTADIDYCSSSKDFAERVWALKPNKRLVWKSCLHRLSWAGKDHRALNGVLTMEYLWSDMSVVEEMLAKAAVLPTVIVEKLAWMTGCRRAWLAACMEKFIERG